MTKVKPKPKRKPKAKSRPNTKTSGRSNAKPKAKVKRKPVKPTPAPKKRGRPRKADAESAARHTAAVIARQRERTAATQEIGPLPAVADPARRAAAMASLRVFCETYFPAKFCWPWSADHLKAIARLEECAVRGGLFALAMTRGGGKTELCRRTVEWAILSGRRRFAVMIGATDDLAEDLLRDIKNGLERNDLLLEDFPEVCHPIRRLRGVAQAARGQTLGGERTRISWYDDEVQLPTVQGSACSGAVIRVCSITGAVKGQNVTAADGGSMRPDFVVLDDIQTRESAASPAQTAKREATVLGDVLEMVGPGTTMAAAMPCTVIYKNDLSERFLDRQRHPEWRGEKFKALYSFPTNTDLWKRYAEIRGDSFRAGGDGSEATAFYAADREAMDAGAVVGWSERMKPGEISGLQSCMNVYFDKPETFAAEWNNEPESAADVTELRQLAEADLVLKLNNLGRGVVPADCDLVTAFVDVQAEILFWAACAWSDRFGGALVEYGTFPAQPVSVFTASEPPVTLLSAFPALERGARVYAGLMELIPAIMGCRFSQDGAAGDLGPSLCMIDARFETKTIHDFVGRSPLRPLLKPSMGRGVSARNKPMNQYRKEPGDLMGDNWRIDAKTTGVGRYVSYDANRWKTFLAEAILAAPGAAGSFYLFGAVPADAARRAAALQTQHPLLTTHLLSEYRVPTAGPWGKLEEWMGRPGERENHWLDCCVGAAVAASILGKKRDAGTAAGDKPAEPERRPAADQAAEAARRRREFQRRRGF